MNECGRELITSDKPAVLAKPLFDAMVMKNSQSDGCLADPASTDESDWSQVFGKTGDPLDQFVTSKTGPRRRGRRFTRWAGYNHRRLYIGNLDHPSGLSPATHLAINDSGLNLIHEFRYNLGILTASRVTRVLDAARYVS